MTRRLAQRLGRFGRKDDGGIFLIEFCLMFPIIFGAFVMAFELSVYSMRHMSLDRGLDIAVRYIRLNTNEPIKHDDIKSLICRNAGFVEDCRSTLRLEMVSVNPRSFATFDPEPDCVDTSKDATPVRGFNLGKEHEMMIMRACVKFKPVFASTGLGYALEKDGSGRARMVAVAAFVQEPN